MPLSRTYGGIVRLLQMVLLKCQLCLLWCKQTATTVAVTSPSRARPPSVPPAMSGSLNISLLDSLSVQSDTCGLGIRYFVGDNLQVCYLRSQNVYHYCTHHLIGQVIIFSDDYSKTYHSVGHHFHHLRLLSGFLRHKCTLMTRTAQLVC